MLGRGRSRRSFLRLIGIAPVAAPVAAVGLAEAQPAVPAIDARMGLLANRMTLDAMKQFRASLDAAAEAKASPWELIIAEDVREIIAFYRSLQGAAARSGDINPDLLAAQPGNSAGAA